ncbi:hypothetical protein KQX54_002779 [Cotesia glomerata]|uniref:Reverse transcriptase zinc-binding domain-containing protein n=1 Tax=Cotesia glomerata TaxID=32391 RepID=A0AAV7HC62_COTGL|nr:hypothetical protein KQX54_002779 [Cotesia glomerata]
MTTGIQDCNFCSTGSKETILHVLIQCPLYSDLSKQFWKEELAQGSDYDKLGVILGVTSKPDRRKLFDFLHELPHTPEILLLTRTAEAL